MSAARCRHRLGQLGASVLAVLLMAAPGLAGDKSAEAWAALAKGGHVALIRHGNAPPGSSTIRVLELEEMVSSWRGPGTLVLVTHGLTVGRLTGVTLEQAETLVLQPPREKLAVGRLPRGEAWRAGSRHPNSAGTR